MASKANIRSRKSYEFWEEEYRFFEAAPTITEILKHIYDLLDSKHAFGSRQQAIWSYESLKVLLEDKQQVIEI